MTTESIKSFITVGNTCKCQSCGYSRQVSVEWMRELVAAGAATELMIGIDYEVELDRLKCSRCGAKNATVTDPYARSGTKTRDWGYDEWESNDQANRHAYREREFISNQRRRR